MNLTRHAPFRARPARYQGAKLISSLKILQKQEELPRTAVIFITELMLYF